MKRPLFTTLLLLSVGMLLPGCPVYDEDGCKTDEGCASGYRCEITTGLCTAESSSAACYRPSDCRTNETCNRHGACRSVDCSWADVGCVSGYECTRDHGVWECVSQSTGGGYGTGGQGSGGQPYGSGGSVEFGGAGGESALGGAGEAGGSDFGGASNGGASPQAGAPAGGDSALGGSGGDASSAGVGG